MSLSVVFYSVADELQNAVNNFSQVADIFHNQFAELDTDKYVITPSHWIIRIPVTTIMIIARADTSR